MPGQRPSGWATIALYLTLRLLYFTFTSVELHLEIFRAIVVFLFIHKIRTLIPNPGSNQEPSPYQSNTLQTELLPPSSHVFVCCISHSLHISHSQKFSGQLSSFFLSTKFELSCSTQARTRNLQHTSPTLSRLSYCHPPLVSPFVVYHLPFSRTP